MLQVVVSLKFGGFFGHNVRLVWRQSTKRMEPFWCRPREHSPERGPLTSHSDAPSKLILSDRLTDFRLCIRNVYERVQMVSKEVWLCDN